MNVRTFVAASFICAGFAHAEVPANPTWAGASLRDPVDLGGAAQIESRLTQYLTLPPESDEYLSEPISQDEIERLDIDHLVRTGLDGSFELNLEDAAFASVAVPGLPPCNCSQVESPDAANRVIVGVGLRMTGGRFVTLWIKRRTIDAAGNLGAVGAWERFGIEPNAQPERIVELPQGKVLVGVGGSVEGDTVTKLGLKARTFDRGYLGGETTHGDATPYELAHRRLPPSFITQVGFRGSNNLLIEMEYESASWFFSGGIGIPSEIPVQLRCPAGKEGVGTVQVAATFNGLNRIGQFGLVCAPKASVTAGQVVAEANMTVVVGAFQDAAARTVDLPAYRSALANEVVKLCPSGYTLDEMLGTADQTGLRRLDSITCRERAATAGPSTQGIAVGVGSMAGALVTLPMVINLPNDKSADGLIIWSGPFTRAFALHFLPR